MDIETARDKARAICQKHRLDAVVHELGGPGGQLFVEVADPNKPDGTTIGVSKEVIDQVAVELGNEIPGCRVLAVLGGLPYPKGFFD